MIKDKIFRQLKRAKVIVSSKIWSNKFVLITFGLSLLINVSIWVIIYLGVKPSEYPVPLHYNIYTGIDVIDFWYKMYIIPTLGLFFMGVNTLLAIYAYNREKIVSQTLIAGSLLLQLVLLVGAIVNIIEL